MGLCLSRHDSYVQLLSSFDGLPRSMGMIEQAKRLALLSHQDLEEVCDFSTGNVFWYMDALSRGKELLEGGAAGSPMELWPREDERVIMQEAVRTADQRLTELRRLLHAFFVRMNSSHATFNGSLSERHVLGDFDAFAAPDVVILLGCVVKSETDVRVATAAAYLKALSAQPLILTSGRGFWQCASSESVLGSHSGQCVNPQFHYPDLLDVSRWPNGVPTEAQYMTKKLREMGVGCRILEDNDALDTVGNALFDYLTLLKDGFFSNKQDCRIVLVTSEYHTLRAFSFYRRVFPSTVQIAAIGSATSNFDSHNTDLLKIIRLGQNAQPMSGIPDRPEANIVGLVSAHAAAQRMKQVLSTRHSIERDSAKVMLSLRDMFMAVDPISGQAVPLPAGEPVNLLFQLFKPKELNGHGLYNGDYNGGPVDFSKTSPAELLQHYLDTYGGQL